MGNIESGAKKEGDLTLGIAPTIRAFDKGGCQIPTMSPLLPGRRRWGLTLIGALQVNHTLKGTSQLLLHCTQSVERERSLINVHLSGREKPSPQSVPWPSLFLLQLDFYHNTLQGTSQLCLHSQQAQSLMNAHPSGREKPPPQSVPQPYLLHILAAASVDTTCYNV